MTTVCTRCGAIDPPVTPYYDMCVASGDGEYHTDCPKVDTFDPNDGLPWVVERKKTEEKPKR